MNEYTSRSASFPPPPPIPPLLPNCLLLAVMLLPSRLSIDWAGDDPATIWGIPAMTTDRENPAPVLQKATEDPQVRLEHPSGIFGKSQAQLLKNPDESRRIFFFNSRKTPEERVEVLQQSQRSLKNLRENPDRSWESHKSLVHQWPPTIPIKFSVNPIEK